MRREMKREREGGMKGEGGREEHAVSVDHQS